MAQPTAPVPEFVIYPDRIGEWRFRFVCDLGESRLRASEGYNAKVNAYKAVESVRRNVGEPKRFEYKANSRGKHFFVLKARNGNILAVSRNHAELGDLQDDADVVQEEVPVAVIREELAG